MNNNNNPSEVEVIKSNTIHQRQAEKKLDKSIEHIQNFMKWRWNLLYMIPAIGLIFYFIRKIYLLVKIGKCDFRSLLMSVTKDNIKKNFIAWFFIFWFSFIFNLVYLFDLVYFFPIAISKYYLAVE